MSPTCQKCKAPVAPDQRFCRQCGAAVSLPGGGDKKADTTRPPRFTWGLPRQVKKIEEERRSHPEPGVETEPGVKDRRGRRPWVTAAVCVIALCLTIAALLYFALQGPRGRTVPPEVAQRRARIKVELETSRDDRDRLLKELQGYGFESKNLKVTDADFAANVVRFGRGLEPEDVKAVAAACLRSGAALRGIVPLKTVSRPVIQVGRAAEVANAPELTEQQVNEMRLAFSFPVVNKFSNLDNALAFARKVQGEVTDYPVEVYLSDDNLPYAVTLGGYLPEDEARKRLGFARQKNIGEGPWVQTAMHWGDNLFR